MLVSIQMLVQEYGTISERRWHRDLATSHPYGIAKIEAPAPLLNCQAIMRTNLPEHFVST
jgi:hypothetical protein